MRRKRRGPLSWRAFDALAVHFPRLAGPLCLLAPPAVLARVDLRRVSPSLRLRGLEARWRLRDARPVDGVAVWLTIGLGGRRRLATLAGTHWSPTLFGVEPLPSGPATLVFRADVSETAPAWEVGLGGAGGSTRRYGPLLAWGWIGPRLSRESKSRR